MRKTKKYSFQAPNDPEFVSEYPNLTELVFVGEGIIKNGNFTGKFWNKKHELPPEREFDSHGVAYSAWGYACKYYDYNNAVTVLASQLPVENANEVKVRQKLTSSQEKTLELLKYYCDDLLKLDQLKSSWIHGEKADLRYFDYIYDNKLTIAERKIFDKAFKKEHAMSI